MFERLQKSFLTTETGEAYQPIRLSYDLLNKSQFIEVVNQLKCCEKHSDQDVWHWFWRDECLPIRFDSVSDYKKPAHYALRLGRFTLKGRSAHLNLPSFKRACLAVSFFQQYFSEESVVIRQADFVNKVFSIDENLPHGFTEFFQEEELDKIIHQRLLDYDQVQERCENAGSVTEALAILSEYTQKESTKRLPYAERYVFQTAKAETLNQATDQEIEWLGFYIFLRSRELVAIRRWFGKVNYTLSDAADEVITQVFGNMDIDILE